MAGPCRRNPLWFMYVRQLNPGVPAGPVSHATRPDQPGGGSLLYLGILYTASCPAARIPRPSSLPRPAGRMVGGWCLLGKVCRVPLGVDGHRHCTVNYLRYYLLPDGENRVGSGGKCGLKTAATSYSAIACSTLFCLCLRYS